MISARKWAHNSHISPQILLSPATLSCVYYAQKVRWWLFIQLQTMFSGDPHNSRTILIILTFFSSRGFVVRIQHIASRTKGGLERWGECVVACLNKFSQHGSNVQPGSGLLWFLICFRYMRVNEPFFGLSEQRVDKNYDFFLSFLRMKNLSKKICFFSSFHSFGLALLKRTNTFLSVDTAWCESSWLNWFIINDIIN